MNITGERLFNIALGLSFLFWAFAGIIQDGDLSFIRIGVASLNTCIGVLLLIRSEASQLGDFKSVILCLPSLIIGGLLFRFTLAFDDWPLIAMIFFGIGLFITIVSFLSLGKNFSILPQVRNIVGSGFYGVVRHPAYLGETVLLIACLLASSEKLYASIAFIAFIPLIIIRILIEEKLLLSHGDYGRYQKRIKWRMIPWVW